MTTVVNTPVVLEAIEQIQTTQDIIEPILVTVAFTCNCAILIIQWFPYSYVEEGESAGTAMSALVFHWMDGMFIKGFNNILNFDDLPSVAKHMSLGKDPQCFLMATNFLPHTTPSL